MSTTSLAVIEGHGDVRRLTLSVDLRAAPSAAWSALTTLDSLQIWWPDWEPGGVFDQREGGRIVIGDGTWLDGQVKVWTPPHLLEFTWRDHSSENWFEHKTRSLARFELLASSAQTTNLRLTQFAPADSVIGGTAGWHSFVERLQRLLEGEPIIDDPDRFDELVRLYSREYPT